MSVLTWKSQLKKRVQMTKGGFHICIQVGRQRRTFAGRTLILQIFLQKKKPGQGASDGSVQDRG